VTSEFLSILDAFDRTLHKNWQKNLKEEKEEWKAPRPLWYGTSEEGRERERRLIE
jgi:hypothetical protein